MLTERSRSVLTRFIASLGGADSSVSTGDVIDALDEVLNAAPARPGCCPCGAEREESDPYSFAGELSVRVSQRGAEWRPSDTFRSARVCRECGLLYCPKTRLGWLTW